MLKIFAMPSRSADPGKQYGRKKLHQKDWTQNTENPVGQSTSCESYWKKKKKTAPKYPIKIFITAHLYRCHLGQGAADKPHHGKE